MYINCTSKCVYQNDGNCTLDELPMYVQSLTLNLNDDCPYCQIPIKSS